MNGKERVKRILDFQEVDAVPYYLMRRLEVEEKLQEYLSVEDIDRAIGSSLYLFVVPTLPREVKTDFDYVGLSSEKAGLNSNKTFYDEFNVGYESTKLGGACPRFHPLAEKASLRDFKLPDSLIEKRYEKIQEQIDGHKDQFILAVKYCGLFERAWFLRGMENLCVDFYENPNFVNDLLDQLLEFNLAIAKELTRFKIDGIMLGDDWGTQVSLMMSPQTWRQFIKPRVAKLYAEIKAADLPVFLHSCGNIMSIIPDLIEIGVNVINPVQVIAMDPEQIKEKYGKKISLFGGVSTQKTFPYGTPEDVQKETRQRIKVLGKGGGYILSPDQELQVDVPIENIIAFIELARSQ